MAERKRRHRWVRTVVRGETGRKWKCACGHWRIDTCHRGRRGTVHFLVWSKWGLYEESRHPGPCGSRPSQKEKNQ